MKRNFSLTFIKVFLINALTMLLITCSSDRPKDPDHFEKPDHPELKINVTGEKVFQLDSLTGYGSPMVQYREEIIDQDTGRYLHLLNTHTNAIYTYDYESTQLVEITHFEKEGQNAIGNLTGFYIRNKDSVFIINENNFLLALVNREGVIQKRYRLQTNNKEYNFTNPIAASRYPIILDDNKLYISSILGDGVNPFGDLNTNTNNLVLVVDLLADSLHATFSYPETYKKGPWGINMIVFYHCFDPATHLFYYSFAADPHIYVTDHGDSLKKFNCASMYFDRILPMPGSNFELHNKHFNSQPSYGSIMFDKYRDRFYRMTYQAISEEDLNSNHPQKSKIKQAGMIVMDHNLKIIGETELSRFRYSETMMFINEKGLHIANWEKSKEDENSLIFDIILFEE